MSASGGMSPSIEKTPSTTTRTPPPSPCARSSIFSSFSSRLWRKTRSLPRGRQHRGALVVAHLCENVGRGPHVVWRAVSVEVRAVGGRRDLTRFIDLPFALHANHPQWVPPLKLERRLFLNRRLNAFFRHGEAEYFLAWRAGRPLGRVSAHVDHAYNAFPGP